MSLKEKDQPQKFIIKQNLRYLCQFNVNIQAKYYKKGSVKVFRSKDQDQNGSESNFIE